MKGKKKKKQERKKKLTHINLFEIFNYTFFFKNGKLVVKQLKSTLSWEGFSTSEAV